LCWGGGGGGEGGRGGTPCFELGGSESSNFNINSH